MQKHMDQSLQISSQNLFSLTTTPRILIVEDSQDNQILLKAFLAKMKLDIDIAHDGMMGTFMALKNAYDVILMDIQMPEMDGFEAVKKLRAAGYLGKIVALTAHAMKGDREKCLDKGFDDYLCKPVSRGTLVDCVLRHVL